MRLRGYSARTRKVYLSWMIRFWEFHARRPPAELGAKEVTEFLGDLVTRRNVSASTQNQALAAILCLYRFVLELEPPWCEDLVRAKRRPRIPVVLSRSEAGEVLAQ
ncbi:MAG: phage integrase N-terminal SAM-like domain-containing protein, partial [Planctomycetes bacterium]|nr:phage integrase N-terminal SAM-like domain-containing protein [Planctomycetota bacterium]